MKDRSQERNQSGWEYIRLKKEIDEQLQLAKEG